MRLYVSMSILMRWRRDWEPGEVGEAEDNRVPELLCVIMVKTKSPLCHFP